MKNNQTQFKTEQSLHFFSELSTERCISFVYQIIGCFSSAFKNEILKNWLKIFESYSPSYPNDHALIKRPIFFRRSLNKLTWKNYSSICSGFGKELWLNDYLTKKHLVFEWIIFIKQKFRSQKSEYVSWISNREDKGNVQFLEYQDALMNSLPRNEINCSKVSE